MKRSLLYRLFGVGKIPAEIGSMLKLEGIVLSDEGIRSSLTYINFRSPGRRSGWRRVWFAGSVTITNARLIALRSSDRVIDVPFADERFAGLNTSLEGTETLLVNFDASLFHSDWSGILEYRFNTPLAKEMVERLSEHVKKGPADAQVQN